MALTDTTPTIGITKSARIYTRATLITGYNERGNEFFYFQSSDGWWDGYAERPIGDHHIGKYVIPNVIKVRFGDYEMTRDEWVSLGCPMKLYSDEAADLKYGAGWEETADALRAVMADLETSATLRKLELEHEDWKDLIATQESARM